MTSFSAVSVVVGVAEMRRSEKGNVDICDQQLPLLYVGMTTLVPGHHHAELLNVPAYS